MMLDLFAACRLVVGAQQFLLILTHAAQAMVEGLQEDFVIFIMSRMEGRPLKSDLVLADLFPSFFLEQMTRDPERESLRRPDVLAVGSRHPAGQTIHRFVGQPVGVGDTVQAEEPHEARVQRAV